MISENSHLFINKCYAVCSMQDGHDQFNLYIGFIENSFRMNVQILNINVQRRLQYVIKKNMPSALTIFRSTRFMFVLRYVTCG